MEEGNPLAALATTGSVGSRFVTQSEIDSAKERREEDWKAAYARLGQEPPPRPTEDAEYDGRSLYERLQTQKTAKQEEWEEKTKLSNQFRALEEDEIHFLDGIMDEKITKENKRKQEENEELKNFREAVAQKAAQESATPSPLPPTSKPPPVKSTTASTPAKNQPKKNQKSLLKGAIVRKSTVPKPGSAVSPSASAATSSPSTAPSGGPAATASPIKSSTKSSASTLPSPSKDEPNPGKKRPDPSLSEAAGEAPEDAQATKRQRV